MIRNSWLKDAEEIMTRVLIRCQKEGKSPEETLEAIDAAYSWGARANHPYKQWLKARKRFRKQLGLIKEPEPNFLGTIFAPSSAEP